MRHKSWKLGFATVVIAVMISPLFARDVTKTIKFTDEQTLSGTQLHKGTYTLKIDDNKVTIEREGKVVAEATGSWQPSETKWNNTMVVSGNDGQIKEFRMRGEKRTFVVGLSSVTNP